MDLLNKFKFDEFNRIMKAVDQEKKTLDTRMHTMNREMEEIKAKEEEINNAPKPVRQRA